MSTLTPIISYQDRQNVPFVTGCLSRTERIVRAVTLMNTWVRWCCCL